MPAPTQTQIAAPVRTHLEHLKHHVTYPTNRAALMEACNNMSDVAEGDRNWFAKTVPEGNYKAPEDVLRALLAKI